MCRQVHPEEDEQLAADAFQAKQLDLEAAKAEAEVAKAEAAGRMLGHQRLAAARAEIAEASSPRRRRRWRTLRWPHPRTPTSTTFWLPSHCRPGLDDANNAVTFRDRGASTECKPCAYLSQVCVAADCPSLRVAPLEQGPNVFRSPRTKTIAQHPFASAR
jgi:hypothetical protein